MIYVKIQPFLVSPAGDCVGNCECGIGCVVVGGGCGCDTDGAATCIRISFFSEINNLIYTDEDSYLVLLQLL